VEPRHTDALRRIYQADTALRDQGQGTESFHLVVTFGGGSIVHPRWDQSWATPSEETILDLGELGFLRLERNSDSVAFSLSVAGRKEAAELFDPKPSESPQVEEVQVDQGDRDPRKVAVMYGRDVKARNWMFDWLRRLDLSPLEWSDLVGLTGRATPYNGEAVEAAFANAQAVVVLLTPDEVGSLHPDLAGGDDGSFDLAGQARLNVILEAGMAFQSHRDQTVLVELGKTREISDLAGLNVIRLDGEAARLSALATRLEKAGCPVRRTGEDWLDTSGLKALSALRREYVPSMPGGGLAVLGGDGSPYWVFRLRGLAVECRTRGDRGWSDWSRIGTLPTEGIGLAASSFGPGHTEVFVLLPTGEVIHTWWLGESGWNAGFESLGTPFADRKADWIAATSTEEGHQEVFVAASDGTLANVWYLHGRWHRDRNPRTTLGDGWSRF
jgi:predicted nucleotide-binding protein